MIRNLAKELLELLKNGKGLSQLEIKKPSSELSIIVSLIASECKCSLVDDEGNFIRYGSSIDIKLVEKIVLNLLGSNNRIPRDIVEKALEKEGISGPKIDLHFTKKHNQTFGITELEITPIMPNDFEIYLGKNNTEIQSKLMDDILKPYVKELIFANEILVKRSPIGAFISKTLFRNKSTESMKRTYKKLLKKHIKDVNRYEIDNYVKYIIDNVLQNGMFKNELINSSINSTELQILGKVYTGFSGLLYNMISTTLSMLTLKDSPNKEISQIYEIYYTMIGVLTSISTDISKMEANVIEDNIKIANRNFSISSEKISIYKSNYRQNDINKDSYGNSIKFVEPCNITVAMNNLIIRIKAILWNKEKMNDEEFIKEVIRINYRFLRIQPFKNANGRTSRALINMILETKGMLACFDKNTRLEYIKSLKEAHEIINKKENEYLYCLTNNPTECTKYEDEYLRKDLPILVIKY